MALPGRVVALESEAAVVRIGGRTHHALTLLCPDVAVGDHVLVTGGIVVARLSPEEAAARRALFDQFLSPSDGTAPSG